MSLEQITVTVQNFITHTRNELLVIKGKWGAGKTFFWRNLINTSIAQKCVGKEYYSYVSLFGINSLEELNNAILVSRVDANPTKAQATLDSLTSNLKKLMGGLEKVPAIREYTGGMIGAALHLLLENTLVCFDDIERRGAGLTVTEIFGVASLLKEQRGCKVVLIMNEEGLDEEGQRQFKLHGEKTVDREIRFSVTEPEAHSYVFPPDFPYGEVIRNCCSILHIENIRTLQRIKRFIEDVKPYLSDLEEELARGIIRSLTLFVWSYHEEENGAPPLQFVLGYSPVNLYLAKRHHKELSADEKRWGEVMSSYNYSHTDDAERCLAQFVDTGFIDEPRIKQELSKANELFRAQKSRDSLTEAYEIFRNSFDNNEEEFLKVLVNNFRSNISVMSVSNLDGVVSTLRGFDQDSLAQTLIDEYFDQHASEENIAAIRQAEGTIFVSDLKDENLLKRLNDIWGSDELDKRSLPELVKTLTSQSGWGEKDLRRLDSFSEQDYYEFFRAEKSSELYYCVRKCLDFAKVESDNKIYKSIGEKAKQALLKLASESRINRIRVSTLFDVDVTPERADDLDATSVQTDGVAATPEQTDSVDATSD